MANIRYVEVIINLKILLPFLNNYKGYFFISIYYNVTQLKKFLLRVLDFQ